MSYTGFHRAVGYIHNTVRRRWPVALACEVEVDELGRLRSGAAAGLIKPSYTACVTKAIAMAVAELSPRYPELNSMMGGFLCFRWVRRFDGISAGVAVSREEEDGRDSVFVVGIPEPQDLTLADLTAQLEDASTAPASEVPDYAACQSLYRLPGFVQRVMLFFGANVPGLHKKHWGTFSLTTVGKFGVDLQMGMPLTTPIQFGFGAVRKRPVVRGDKIEPALTMNLTMAFDRRLLNGKPPCAMLARVQHILQTADDRRWFEARELTRRPSVEATLEAQSGIGGLASTR